MNWLALLTMLLPLIEMLLKLFAGKNAGSASERKLLRARLDACNTAVAGAAPSELKKHARMVKRLQKANKRAEELGI